MKTTISLKHKIIMCLLALLITGLFGMGNVLAQTPVASVKIKEDETVEKAFTSLEDAWAYATGFDEETLPGTNTKVKSDSRRTNYAEITLYDNCTTTKTLTVPAGVTVRIYMNGKQIAYEGTGSTGTETNPGSVFVVNGERNAPGALFLDGGIFPETSIVTGGKAADKGGGICVNEYGELTLHDVTIKGNVAQNKGGGVFLTSDGTGHGKMTVGGTVTIDGNRQGKTSEITSVGNYTLQGGKSDNLYISGEEKDPGMDIDGIYNDAEYSLAPDSCINVTHVPNEKIMRDPNREMMGCFKNEKENYVFRYKKFNNTDIEKAGDYIVLAIEDKEPEIKNVTFSTANGEDIEPVKGTKENPNPNIDYQNKTITVTLDTENDLKNLIAEISTTQEVMVRAKDDKPELLPASRQDFELYAGCFAPADYSDPNGRKFILYGFDGDSKNPDNKEWTVKVNATKRTITFDTMGGGALTDSFPDSIVVDKGTRFDKIENPSGGLPKTAGTDFVAFPGRTLEGWYFDKTLQRRVTGEEVINNSMTLYAKWYVREFPINYFMTGTPNNPENPAYFNVNSGNFTIKNPKGYENNTFNNNGKLFIGWSYKDFHNRNVDIGNTLSPQIPSGSFINASTASLDYTPQYMTQQHNVVLDFGGAGEIENKNVMVDHGNTFIANNYIPLDQSLPTGVKWLKDLEEHALDCNNSSITEDTTLYAAYTLFLDANGGNYGSNSQRASGFFAINDNYTSFLTKTENIPARADDGNNRYVFDGWYTKAEGGEKVSAGVMPGKDVELFAHWLTVPKDDTAQGWQTIRFDTGGVDMPADAHGIALQQGSTEITASDFDFTAKPTRNGYTFAGWYTAEGYNADGSLNNPSQNQIWNGDSGPQTLSLPTYTEGASKDLTLYAKWEQSETQTHTVSFSVNHFVMEPDGKTFKNCNNGLKTYNLTLNAVMKVPTLTDDELQRAFGGITSEELNKVVVMPHDQYVRVDKDVKEVNYYYIRKSFPYYYQYNGTPSNFIDKNKSTKNGYYPYGAQITITHTGDNQLLHGSSFSHWGMEWVDINGNDKGTAEIYDQTVSRTMPAKLLSIKPVTTPYSGGTLKINLDDGKLDDTDANANPTVNNNQITFTGKSQTLTMPTPTKAGYEFVGWQYNQSGDKPSVTANPLVIDVFAEIDNIKAGKPTTYTAVWKKDVKTLTVDFNLNGHGAPQPKSQTGLAPGSKLPRDCVIAIKNVKAAGYNNEDDEVEWYKDAACTDGQKFVVDNDTVNENMTLYAKWKPQKYNVSLNANGGTLPANQPAKKIEYTIESNAITLKNPTWPGKTFAGWTGTGLDKPTVNVTIPTGSTGNRTYKANWTTGLYTVNFDTQGKGKAPADQKVLGDDNHLVQRPVNPTEKGYSFEGWFTDKAGTVPYSFNYPLKASQLTNGTLTLYAKWKPILYQLNLDANGGKFKDGSKEKTERRYINDNISIIYTDNFTPTRENYLFMGWKTAKEKDKGEYFEDKTMPPQNITLYADWYEIPFVKITFDTHGGTVLPTQFVRSGSPITKPNDPQKTGYVFDGWFTDDQYKVGWNFDAPATDSMTLHANWRLNQYKLTLDPNGGSFENGSTDKKELFINYNCTLGNDLLTVNPPSGKKFIGWFSGHSMADADHQYTAQDKMPAYNLTLVAQYVDDHSIYFDANGGKLSIDNPLVEVTTESITPPEVTRTGYKFDYWYLDDAAQPFNFNKITWADGETVKVLKAKWEPNPLTITLDANGGKFSNQNGTKTHNAFYDDTAISFGNSPKQSIYDPDNRPTKEGYFFVGWYTDPTKETDTYVDGSKSLTENTTYYAHWTPAPGIVVMFETFGGSPVSPQVLEGGNKATRPEQDPTKPGRSFAGWYQDKECTIPFDFDTPITQNTTIYAKWNTVKYHINAYPNGGTIPDTTIKDVQKTHKTGNDGDYTEYEYTYDTPTYSVDKPTRNGYTFAGWTWTVNGEARERKAMTYTVPQGSTVDQTITATWQIDKYNIAYDLGGGKMNESDINPTSYNVETATFTLKKPTRVGYNFAGWTGTDLTDKTVDVTINKGSTGDRAYKANWTPIEYSITCELAGGSLPEGKTNPETYTIESETIVLNNPTREGYTFAGWTGTGLSGPMQKVIIPKESIGEKSYTATWQPITYNISYDLDGGKIEGSSQNPTTYTVEDNNITLINPTKKGYNFTGWTGTGIEGSSQSVTISQGSTGHRSYKATWTPQKYTLILDPAGGKFADGTTDNKTVTDVEYNTPLYGKLPMDLTKDEHHFCGWNDQPNGKGKLYTSNMKMPALANNGDTLTLTAQWGENRIIYFDINPDTDEGDIQQIPAESGYAQRPTPDPTRNHYTFTGWYADPDCTEPFDFENTKITDVFTVIYAGWIPKSYDITYDLDGGYLSDGLDNPDDFTIEDYFTLNNPVKTGHTFDGWTGSNGTTADKTVTIDGEDILGNREEDDSFKLEYTANWTVNQYKVTFNNMGKGNPTAGIPSQEYGKTITEPTDPKQIGYTFEGWYKNEALTDRWDFAKDTMPDHDITLYAKWRADKVAVKVVHQRMNLSGKYDTDESLIETEELKAYSDSLITPATKTYEGFTSPPVQTVSVDPSGNTVVTYQYERNQYILVLNDDENLVDYDSEVNYPTDVNPIIMFYNWITGTSTGSKDKKTTDTDIYYYGTPLQFNRKDTIPDGQAWYGWIMSNSADEWIKLSEAQNITMTMPADDITVEPMVVDGEFTITYDLAGGALPAGKTNPDKYTYGDSFTLINPTRSGYIFTGWTGGGNAVPTKTVTIKKDDFGDRHYTANWQRIVHTVTFDCNDERIEPIKVSVNDGAKVKEPEVPELDDRVFEYWMTKDGEPYDFNKPVYQNMTLYAKWTDIEPDPEPEKPTPTIYYRGHVQNIGWQTYQGSEWLADTDTVSYIGTTGRALRLEAMEIAVPSGYTVTGFAHIQNRGDTEVEKLPDGITVDGEPYDVYRFGTTGKALRMEAIDFDILKDGKCISTADGKGPVYRVHIQNGGWQGTVRGGSFAGTRGGSLRLEAMSFSVIR